MANPTGAAPTAASSTSTSTSSSSLPPLPPGWTENKAPTGHTYYYNAQTRESTYRRPLPPPPAPPPPGAPPPPRAPLPPQASTTTTYSQPFPSHPFPGAPQGPIAAPALRLSDPRVANAFMAQQNAANNPQHHEGGGRGGRGGRGGFGGRGGRGGGNDRPRPQPTDKPRSRIPIPGHEPWVLVYTKYGRRFVYNSTKNASYWRIPEKLMPAILEMDKAGIHKKVEAAMGQKDNDKKTGEAPGAAAKPSVPKALVEDLDSDYEEVEVTDDEDGEEGQGDGGDEDGPRKRQRKGEPGDDEMAVDGEGGDGRPIEFSEADIAYQLAAAAAEYDDYGQEEWDGEGEEGYDDQEGQDDGGEGQDGATLFKALLDDFQINPFSPWEKLVEEGKVFDDPRYTALPNMKARKAVWEEWSRDGIQKRKEQKAREDKESVAKKDPRAPYLQLLENHATPKLYWAEFKRKYRKDPGLKDSVAPHKEKDKEKMYRDYVARLKLSSSTRKADLTKLLESLPRSDLNNQTDPKTDLPHELTGDLRYVAVEASVRDALVEAFIRSAGPP